jgi:hypothetical protein
MFLKVVHAIWNFLEAWGEMKYEFHKKHNLKAWY